MQKAASEGRQPSVYGATFPSSFALYVFDPALLAGWNGPLRDYEKKWIPEKYKNLPVLGGWYGQGMIPDSEVLFRAKPDVAFLISTHRIALDSEKTLRKLGIPLIMLPGVTIENDIAMFRSLGEILGERERGEALSGYAEAAFARLNAMLADMPESERVRIYMAQGASGLESSCQGSTRSTVFEVAGGVNVNECPDAMREQIAQLSFEHVMLLDPDVILVSDPGFMKRVKTDSRWQSLRAAREGRVFNVPYEPFSWLDRPASFMRFLGAQWLATKIHSGRCPINMTAETTTFMKLFFHADITEEQAREILNP